MYVPLHVHSDRSLLDGLSQPEHIAKRIEEINAPACALTDHGVLAASVEFASQMKAKKKKPIFGVELYVCKNDPKDQIDENRKLAHQVILSKNHDGWFDLVRLTSFCNDPEHFYYKPRTDIKNLQKFCNGNFISFSGHLGSTLARTILEDDKPQSNWEKDGLKFIHNMCDMFGKENFYLEVQLYDAVKNPIQKTLTDLIRQLSKKSGVKCVATPDAHYCCKEDATLQRVILCTSLNTTIPIVKRQLENGESTGLDGFFKSDHFHIPTYEEMYEYGHTTDELETTLEIAEKCDDYSITSKPMLPPFPCPNGESPSDYLRQLCRDGWKAKIAHKLKDEAEKTLYADRVKYELSVLQGADLDSYFLIVRDILNYCRENDWLVGPGRGSSSGCLVSYLIGITTVDPIPYGLIFERFYNAGRNTADRIAMPDIDFDIPVNARDKVIEYIKTKYGSDKVGQIITYSTFKGKAAIKAVLRTYGQISFEEQNMITKHFPDPAKIVGDLEIMKQERDEASIIIWTLENKAKELEQWCKIEEDGTLSGPLATEFKEAIKLEKTKAAQSKHAAGVVVGPKPLSEICPMVYDSKTNQMNVGLEMEDAEAVGLLKLDALGLAALDKLQGTKQILRGEEITI